MKKVTKFVTVHGKKATTPFSEPVEYGGCRPECSTCGTGMVCATASDTHYCIWHECPDNDRTRFLSEYPR